MSRARSVMSGFFRVVGWPARALLLGTIGLYRLAVSPLTGNRCRFHPSCSAYAAEAVRTHGAARGAALAAWRVLRCSPLSAGGVDPVPARRSAPGYDAIIQREGAA